MVRGDVRLAEPLGEVARDPLRDAALVDEDQRGAMLVDQLGEPVVHLAPHFGRHHRGERRARHFDREIAVAHMAGVDDLHRFIALADEETRHLVQRLHGGGQADAHRGPLAQRLEPFQRKHQVRTALAAGHRVQLVDDHALHRLQHRAARVGAEQDVQGLRRRHQDVRRRAAHALALRRRRVAGAHRVADADVGQAHRDQPRANAGQRFLQVLADVVGQRLQRRHVEHVDLVREPAGEAFAHQLVDGRQEGRERLARTGGRGDQRMAALRGDCPGLGLDLGRAAEAALQPGGNGRVERKLGHPVFSRLRPGGVGGPSATRTVANAVAMNVVDAEKFVAVFEGDLESGKRQVQARRRLAVHQGVFALQVGAVVKPGSFMHVVGDAPGFIDDPNPFKKRAVQLERQDASRLDALYRVLPQPCALKLLLDILNSCSMPASRAGSGGETSQVDSIAPSAIRPGAQDFRSGRVASRTSSSDFSPGPGERRKVPVPRAGCIVPIDSENVEDAARGFGQR